MIGKVFSGDQLTSLTAREQSQPRAEVAVVPFLHDVMLPVNRDALFQLRNSDTSLKRCFDAVVIDSDNLLGI